MSSSTEEAARNQRHRLRMQRKKDVVDGRIAAATTDRGVLLVLTGNGKGKSSSAFGMAARALAHGMKVGVVQFIKGAVPSGEETFFRRAGGEQIDWHVMGEGYTWETQDRSRDVEKAAAAWAVARRMLDDERYGLVLLDELNIALKHRYLAAEEVVTALLRRPPMQHAVVTGRAAPPELCDAADTVTEMMALKHAFQAGIRAQKGVEL
jgi:cob(I)alamin adenosyltransferase